MTVTIDGYDLELSVAGGSLIVVQNGNFQGSLNLQELPEPAAPLVLESDVQEGT